MSLTLQQKIDKLENKLKEDMTLNYIFFSIFAILSLFLLNVNQIFMIIFTIYATFLCVTAFVDRSNKLRALNLIKKDIDRFKKKGK